MSAPPQPHLRFRSAAGEHLFVARYSRLFDLDSEDAARFDRGDGADRLLDRLGRMHKGDDALDAVDSPDPQSISLNVSASCNLACGYCYAGRGGFGGNQASAMGWEVARAAVDRLLEVADPQRPITIGFMGGEPLLARELVHRVVGYAAGRASESGLDIRFSMTTNGTLLDRSDLELIRNHSFAVTVSLDGSAAQNDRQRPQAGGRGSWAQVARRVAPLLADPGSARIAARATVTAGTGSLQEAFDAIVALGFPEVGLAPLRTGDPASAIRGDAWERYGEDLIALARRELPELVAGRPLRLTNFAVALKQIHRGACSPYPCGAGGGYFSVASNGDWYACHRAVGEDRFRLGSNAGLDDARRSAFLSERHVDGQVECSSCWARYLCSGGCHHEASERSPQSCDFIRRWLQFCIESYCTLSDLHNALTQRKEMVHA